LMSETLSLVLLQLSTHKNGRLPSCLARF
jgi:hypothetical protein